MKKVSFKKALGYAATGASVAGMVRGAKHDTGSSGLKKTGKAVLLGGGYSGYQRARNEGQGRLKAGIKATLGGTAYSAYKGTKKESITEKAIKGKKGLKKDIRHTKRAINEFRKA
jgi:hypothetical protein